MRLVATLTTFFLIGTAALAAHGYIGEDSSSTCAEVSVGADFLLWKPISSETDFVNVIDLRQGAARAHCNDFEYDWEPGFRVFVGLQPACSRWEFVATYEQVDSSDRQSFIGGEDLFAASPLTIVDVPILFGQASGSSHLDYKSAELAAYYGRCLCDGHLFRPLVALQYLRLEKNIHFSGATIDEELNFEIDSAFSTKYNAVGFSVGVEYSYDWLCGLSLYTKGLATVNVGRASNHMELASNSEELQGGRFHCKSYEIVPQVRLALGLAKNFCICGRELFAKVGYEFVDFINVPEAVSFFNDGNHSGGNVGFHGFSFGLEHRF